MKLTYDYQTIFLIYDVRHCVKPHCSIHEYPRTLFFIWYDKGGPIKELPRLGELYNLWLYLCFNYTDKYISHLWIVNIYLMQNTIFIWKVFIYCKIRKRINVTLLQEFLKCNFQHYSWKKSISYFKIQSFKLKLSK